MDAQQKDRASGQAPSSQVKTSVGQRGREPGLPPVDHMRCDPGISEPISQLLSQYDAQAQADGVPCKNLRKKSGWYNITDTTLVAPEYRWPNEGFISLVGRKPAYDDLSLAQWVSGQLNNMRQIEDAQVSLAIRDAVLLPWPTAHGAWELSMTEVEEGHLDWSDATQWALNCINGSQVAVLNSQALAPTGGHVLICKLFNEGTCTNKNHHGPYKHCCSSSHRNGKSLGHPEFKCVTKVASRNVDPKTNNHK